VFAGAFVASGQTSTFSHCSSAETQLRLTRVTDETATLAPAFRVDNPARYYDNGLARSINSATTV